MCFRKHKNLFAFYTISQSWNGTCSWNSVFWKTRTNLSAFSILQFLMARGPFNWRTVNLIPTLISIYMPNRVWDIITNPFPKFNGCTAEVSEWIRNFILHFLMGVFTYSRLWYMYWQAKTNPYVFLGVYSVTHIEYTIILFCANVSISFKYSQKHFHWSWMH